jgi:uncharacterized protein DUF397
MNRDRHNLPETSWRKAGRCGPNGGNCVEVNRGAAEVVGVRDSKNAAGRPLLFGSDSWAAFLAVKR